MKQVHWVVGFSVSLATVVACERTNSRDTRTPEAPGAANMQNERQSTVNAAPPYGASPGAWGGTPTPSGVGGGAADVYGTSPGRPMFPTMEGEPGTAVGTPDVRSVAGAATFGDRATVGGGGHDGGSASAAGGPRSTRARGGWRDGGADAGDLR